MKKKYISAALAFALLCYVRLTAPAKVIEFQPHRISLANRSLASVRMNDSVTARLPLIFEANAGQFADEIAFFGARRGI